ncbi:hypothetical protein ACFV1W_32130 [Kitasatospora sp. NPDC059648]|uniref:hypothetical protein n=1 Tax=Kitasatospora sp. NPDC059648 TaxID=3346894 RepID=UPI003690AD31
MTTDAESSPPSEDSGVDKLKNGLGVLLTGFAAALNFLGLRSSELTTVLRNNPLEATLVAAIMLLALTVAMTATFLSNSRTMPPYFVPSIFAACIGLTALVICAIDIPRRTAPDACPLAALSAGGLFLAMVILGFYWCGWGRSWAWIRRWLRHRTTVVPVVIDPPEWAELPPPVVPPAGSRPGITSVLLICAVILTSLAAFAAARLETKSQTAAAYPQVSASLKSAGSVGVVSVAVESSKLAYGDKIGVVVQAIPRSFPLGARCFEGVNGAKKYWRLDDCLINTVCNTVSHKDNPCEVITSGSLEPDANGAVKAVIENPISLSAYQFIDVRAQICDVDTTSGTQACVYDKNRTAAVFLGIPPT